MHLSRLREWLTRAASINRRAFRFLPHIEKMSRKHRRPVGGGWCMDETCIKVWGVRKYHYRAVDKQEKPSTSC